MQHPWIIIHAHEYLYKVDDYSYKSRNSHAKPMYIHTKSIAILTKSMHIHTTSVHIHIKCMNILTRCMNNRTKSMHNHKGFMDIDTTLMDFHTESEVFISYRARSTGTKWDPPRPKFWSPFPTLFAFFKKLSWTTTIFENPQNLFKRDRGFGNFYLGIFIRARKKVPTPKFLLFWRDPNPNLDFGVPAPLRRIKVFLLFQISKMLQFSPIFKVLAGRGPTMVPKNHSGASTCDWLV